MMITWWAILIMFVAGAVVTAGAAVIGGFLMFRGRSVPGNDQSEKFFGGEGKGEIFTIPDDSGGLFSPAGPEDKTSEKLKERTEKFLNVLSGGK